MASRLYFFDALTDEELVTFPHHGAEPRMGHGSGVSARSGIRYTDTCAETAPSAGAHEVAP
jgi:hypothetical protein